MAEGTLRFGDISVGQELPALDVPITTTLIVAGALASRDYTPVHHDRSAAVAQGMQDVFMNILTTNGLVGRFVTDWTGPDAVVKGVSIQLGSPNLPGDTMRMSGTGAAIDHDNASIEVSVAGTNSWGNHVTGTVRVSLPR